MAGSTWNAINSQVPYQLLGGSGGPPPPHDHGVSQTFSFGRRTVAGVGVPIPFAPPPLPQTTYFGSAGLGILPVPAAMGVPVSISSGLLESVEFYADSFLPPLLIPTPPAQITIACSDLTGAPQWSVVLGLTLPWANQTETLTLPGAGQPVSQGDYLSCSLNTAGIWAFPAVRFVIEEI